MRASDVQIHDSSIRIHRHGYGHRLKCIICFGSVHQSVALLIRREYSRYKCQEKSIIKRCTENQKQCDPFM